MNLYLIDSIESNTIRKQGGLHIMRGFFSKSFHKKRIPIILLVCLLTESIFFPNMTLVHATEMENESNTQTTIQEVETTDVTNDIIDTSKTDLSTTSDSSKIDETLHDDTLVDDTLPLDEDQSLEQEDTKDNSDTFLALSKENFPDEIFRKYIYQNFDFDKDSKLSIEEIAKVDSIDVSNMGISNLTGIEYFTNLLYLYCNGNKLSSLTVHTLVNLTVLDCSNNYLTNIDLSNCSSLSYFEANNNAKAISLDEQKTFDLSSLKEFDLSQSYDWSENAVISDKLLSILAESDSMLITYRYKVNAPLLEDLTFNGSFIINTVGQSDVEINDTNFPDPMFQKHLSDTYDLNQDLTLSVEELNNITYLYIPGLELSSLVGIEHFTNLVYLNFDDNAITNADLNPLVNLRSVSCSNNNLSSLSLQSLTQLESLYCSNNQLYSLDLSGCSSLDILDLEHNTHEVSVSNHTVELSLLTDLDSTRTSDWSSGTLTPEYNLFLEELKEEAYVTYQYATLAPNDTLGAVTFTLKILPAQEELEPPLNTTTPQSSPDDASNTQTEPTQSVVQAKASIPTVTTPVTKYTVSFNTNGGNGIASQSVSPQGIITIPPQPVKASYLFKGWYNQDVPYNFESPVTKDVTLTAQWDKVTPKKPSIKSLKNTSKSKMKITIKTVKNIDGYEVSYSTNKNAKKNAILIDTGKSAITVKNLIKGKTYYVRVRSYSYDSTGQKIYSGYSKIKKLSIKKGLAEEKPTSTSATITSAKLDSKNTVIVEAKTKNSIKSSDNYYYLFALPSYKNSIAKNAVPLASTLKNTSFKLNTALNLNTSKSLLYQKFVVAVKVKSGYKVISKAKYITNPQKIADFTYSFPTASSKKGLQINAGMLHDVKDLGVKHVAYNIPLNLIIAAPGETNYRSSVDYEYNGETYWFRKGMIAAYDSLFRNLENQDIVVSAIVLLGWRDDLTYLITPSGREEGHNYYNFNTSSKKARNQLEATFSFLAERYASGAQNGKVVNWIIGNEVNSFDAWNYSGTKSLSKHTQLYADSFRLAYVAMKSVYSNVRLYVSLDQCWTMSNAVTFGGKEFLEKFDSYLKETGNISWNLAYHAYPSPLTDPRFWENANGQSQNNENTPVISISNISVLTKYVKKNYGKKTRIILSEQGFTSAAPYGEKTQAAAIAYAYYLTEFNSMIDSLILSRHVDNIAETKDRLNLGLWTNEPGQIEEAYQKKYAWNVYKYMDTPSSTNATKFALKIIGSKNWKKIVPGYKANKFKSMPKAN